MSIYSNEHIFGTAVIFCTASPPPPPTFCVFDFSCDTEQEAGDNRMNWVTVERELGDNLRSLRQWVRSLFSLGSYFISTGSLCFHIQAIHNFFADLNKEPIRNRKKF
jgi:hypothetical protein